jgi:hypothetical protein
MAATTFAAAPSDGVRNVFTRAWRWSVFVRISMEQSALAPTLSARRPMARYARTASPADPLSMEALQR